MKSNVSRIEERQFITKEFADTIAGKAPAPYLRLHDPVQKETGRNRSPVAKDLFKAFLS
jgi:hypothetical protein